MEDVIELARRRGFLWPSFEIYGGASGFYDYGPLGATLKNRVENVWRRFFVIGEGYMEISSPTIGLEDVFAASGHLSHFVDPIVTCMKCGEAYRADHLLNECDVDTEEMNYQELGDALEKNRIFCPSCKGKLSQINTFNLMFKTAIGAGDRTGYLRPETAQNMFILFNRLYGFYRKKLPFGVSQIGRAYRNEISPRQGLLRLREFSQAEVEVFVDPAKKERHNRFPEISSVTLHLFTADGDDVGLSAEGAVEKKIIAHQTLAYHMVRTLQFLVDVGIREERIRFRQHKTTEMAHYACDCWDAEVLTERYGWVEVVGIADRTDFDLKSHIEKSGEDLSAFIRFEESKIEKLEILEPNMKKLGQKYKGDALNIANLIKTTKPNKVLKDGSLEIADGHRIPSDFFIRKKKEVRIEGEKIIPHVIEPSFGIDRIIYSILESAYSLEERNGEKRVVLHLKLEVTPYDVAVFSLVSKDGLDEKAHEVFDFLRMRGFLCSYDSSGTIGRRYARADEIGIPYAVTVDFQTLEDNTVTIRDRDTMEQKRVKIETIPSALKETF